MFVPSPCIPSTSRCRRSGSSPSRRRHIANTIVRRYANHRAAQPLSPEAVDQARTRMLMVVVEDLRGRTCQDLSSGSRQRGQDSRLGRRHIPIQDVRRTVSDRHWRLEGVLRTRRVRLTAGRRSVGGASEEGGRLAGGVEIAVNVAHRGGRHCMVYHTYPSIVDRDVMGRNSCIPCSDLSG